jgi:hypothetical protein
MYFICGAMFLTVGLLFGITFTIAGIKAGELFIAMFGICFGSIFVIAAVWAFIEGTRVTRKNARIIKYGKQMTGEITGYLDGSGVVFNGMPPLVLVVQVDMITYVVPTGSYDESEYPIGKYVDFAQYAGDCFVIKGSLSD